MDYDENVMAMVNATKGEDGVTVAELVEFDRLYAVHSDRGPHRSLVETSEAKEKLESMAPDLLPRLVKAYRRTRADLATEQRDRYVATLGEADAYARGRREAIEEASRWLRLHAHDHAANIVKRHEAELNAKGADVASNVCPGGVDGRKCCPDCEHGKGACSGCGMNCPVARPRPSVPRHG